MQIYLVKSSAVFWSYSKEKMCKVTTGFFPAKDSDEDRKYCTILENSFKKKHGSKAWYVRTVLT